METTKRRCRKLAAVALATAAISSAWGAESPIEMKGCIVTESTVIDKVGEVTIGLNVTRGQMDVTGGPSDKMTHDCRVLWAASKAGLEFTNRCVNTDKDGDKTITMANGTPKSFQWRYLSGSGKFAGITGGGTAEITTRYPRGGNVSASCWQGRGTYTLSR
jgi:hypothetical protein